MYFQKRGNKYNNTPTNYGGSWYQSKKEAAYAEELDWRLKAKDIKSWEKQVPIELRVNDRLIATYKVDFKVYHNDGTIEYIEIKGFITGEWRIKWKLFEALYGDDPNITLTVIK